MRRYGAVCGLWLFVSCSDARDLALDGSAVDLGSKALDGSLSKEPAPPEPSLTYHEHVKPIVDAKCTQCHSESGIGPMPLTTYAEVAEFTGLVRDAVLDRRMPPWMATGDLDLFEGDRRLTDEQVATLVGWIDQGALEGDPDDEGPALERFARTLERVDLTLELSGPYEPQNVPDDYHCFVFDWPYETTEFITGLNFEPGTRAIVHHAIVYHLPPEDAAAVRERDAQTPEDGYTCFSAGASSGGAAWLMSWEPGGYGQPLPGGAGYAVAPGSVMVAQIHYNTLAGLSRDQSRVEFTIESAVDVEARVALFMDSRWSLGQMPIPANEKDVVHMYQGLPAVLSDGMWRVHWVDLHMHALGSSGRIGVFRGGKDYEPWLEIPEWDFAWQETYIWREPRMLYPEDILHLECHWDNTQENQIVIGGERLPVRDVNWGDGTTDEMCLGNILVSRIP